MNADDKRLLDQVNAANNAGAVECAHEFEARSTVGDPYESCDKCGEIRDLPLDTPPATRSEVETLDAILRNTTAYARPGRGIVDRAEAQAEAVLASDWLAQHDAQVAAKASERVYGHMLALAETEDGDGDPTGRGDWLRLGIEAIQSLVADGLLRDPADRIEGGDRG